LSPSSRRSNAAEGEAETAQGTRHKGRDMTVYLVVGIAGLLFVLAGVCFWLINKDAKKVVPHHPDPIPAIPVKSAAE